MITAPGEAADDRPRHRPQPPGRVPAGPRRHLSRSESAPGPRFAQGAETARPLRITNGLGLCPLGRFWRPAQHIAGDKLGARHSLAGQKTGMRGSSRPRREASHRVPPGWSSSRHERLFQPSAQHPRRRDRRPDRGPARRGGLPRGARARPRRRRDRRDSRCDGHPRGPGHARSAIDGSRLRRSRGDLRHPRGRFRRARSHQRRTALRGRHRRPLQFAERPPFDLHRPHDLLDLAHRSLRDLPGDRRQRSPARRTRS